MIMSWVNGRLNHERSPGVTVPGKDGKPLDVSNPFDATAGEMAEHLSGKGRQ